MQYPEITKKRTTPSWPYALNAYRGFFKYLSGCCPLPAMYERHACVITTHKAANPRKASRERKGGIWVIKDPATRRSISVIKTSDSSPDFAAHPDGSQVAIRIRNDRPRKVLDKMLVRIRRRHTLQ